MTEKKMTECNSCNRFHSIDYDCPSCETDKYAEKHKDRISKIPVHLAHLIREFQRCELQAYASNHKKFKNYSEMYQEFAGRILMELGKLEEGEFYIQSAKHMSTMGKRMLDDDENCQELLRARAHEKAVKLAEALGLTAESFSMPGKTAKVN